jgi:hypothetical protein
MRFRLGGFEIVRVSGSRIEKCKRCRKEATGADDSAAVSLKF